VLDITQTSPEYVSAILEKLVPEYEEGIVNIDKI
jgi:transcription antitermination factor NusA-like protein